MIRKTLKILLPILMVFISISLTLEAFATNYYVNESTGSDSYNGFYGIYQGGSDGPWKTMGKAASAVPSGGHVINVAAGTYSESRVTDSRSGADPGYRYWLANGEVIISNVDRKGRKGKE